MKIDEKILSILATLLILLSSVAVTGVSSISYEEETNESTMIYHSEEDMTSLSGKLTDTFLKVESVRADSPVVYLDRNNNISVKILNSGANVGDESYTENITASIEDIEALLELYSNNPRNKLLEKAIESLEEALLLVSEHQREESIKSVRQAVVHLHAAGQGRHGIPREDVITALAETVELKVWTVIEQARSSFGSEHPDVHEAEDIYEDAVDKLEDGKYIPAMNRFRKAFEIVLGAYVCDVNLELYSWMRDGYESEIGSGYIESFEAESYEVITITWNPTRRGINYVRVNIAGEYIVYSSDGEAEESPTKTFSFGFVVTSEDDEEERWGPGGPGAGYHDYSNVSADEGIRYRDGPRIIFVEDSNLTIESGAALQLNESITLVMENEYAEQFSIVIEPDAAFIIESEVGDDISTIITAPNRNTYPFLNHGTVHFTGASVMKTFGNRSDLEEPAGIQNLPGSTCILDNTNVLEADTHSVYVTGNTEAHIRGTETIIGRLDEHNENIATGHGVFVDGATSHIENVTVQHNQMNGIKILSSSYNNITNNILLTNNIGIYLRFAHDNLINNNTAPSNDEYGIYLMKSERNTITNNTVKTNYRGYYGIYLRESNSNTLENNSANSNSEGILLMLSSNNKIHNNTANSNDFRGIYLSASSDNTITNNIANSNNWAGIYFDTDSSYNVIGNNDLSKNGFGIVIQRSSNNIIQNNIATMTVDRSIYLLASSNNNTIYNNTANSEYRHGIYLQRSHYNTISNNDVSDNDRDGIYIEWSSNNILKKNIAYFNGYNGIYLYSSCNNTIINNLAKDNNRDGFYLDMSDGTKIVNNTVLNNNYGIYLSSSKNNTIANNTLSNNYHGIYMEGSSSSIIRNNRIGTAYYSVENELVYGPASGGETWPFYLDNEYISECTLYLDNGYELYELTEGVDYILDYEQGEIYLIDWTLSTGDIIYADYTYLIPNDGNIYGIYSIESSPTIEGNKIIWNEKDGIHIDNYGDLTHTPVIKDNTIYGHRDGVGVNVLNSAVLIKDNLIASNRDGGIIMYNSTGEINQNIINGNCRPWSYTPPEWMYTGIHLLQSDNVWIHNNNLSSNRVNIAIEQSSNINIEWNEIIDQPAIEIKIYPPPPSTRGIISIDSQSEISNNTIRGTSYGMIIEYADDTTIINDNKFYPMEEYGALNALHLKWSSPIIKNNNFSHAEGWGIYSIYGAPANSGVNGTQLIEENTFGYCGQGWVVQYWRFQVRVLEHDEAVEGADVVIWDNLGGAAVWEGTTDENGDTDEIVLPQYSWDSEGEKTQYSPYTVLVDSDYWYLISYIHLESNILLEVDVGTGDHTIKPY